jgi:hypothetical protein
MALYPGVFTIGFSLFRANSIGRLADKALGVLHHLARRGSVWPEASATAVRELRDRITQRASRALSTNQASVSTEETNAQTSRVRNVDMSTQPTYTSSNGLEPRLDGHNSNTNYTISSTGLPQEAIASNDTQTAAIAPTVSSNTNHQAEGALHSAGNAQPLDAPLNNNTINAPVFDFGTSEWSDFLQANNSLAPNTQLPSLDSIDPYIGFDIPFWLGQDQYFDMLHDRP